jgi:hypothetical protein
VAALLVVVAACGSANHGEANVGLSRTTTTAGRADSSYWVAGWTPEGAYPDSARGSDAAELLGYSTSRPFEDDIQIEVTTYSGPPPKSSCDNQGIGAVRTTTRGHPSCEGPDSDEGRQFGWVISWVERPGLEVNVINHDPETVAGARPVARHIAASLRPASQTEWNRLVEMTTYASGQPGDPPMTRVDAAHGVVGGATWTLTALVPKDFPLAPDDRRWPCVTLSYRGTTARTECQDGVQGGRVAYARLDGQPFAFGLAGTATRFVDVQKLDYLSGALENRLARHVATLAVDPVHPRFFAVPLPRNVCRARVTDATAPGHPLVGDADPIDAGPPCQPPTFGGPPTTAPH